MTNPNQQKEPNKTSQGSQDWQKNGQPKGQQQTGKQGQQPDRDTEKNRSKTGSSNY